MTIQINFGKTDEAIWRTIFVEHAGWDDPSDRDINVVGTKHLEVVDDAAGLAHDNELSEGRHVQKTNPNE